MKAKLFVIGWFMLVLSACTSTKIPEPAEEPSLELCAIDSLMWRHPDSALKRLLPWFDTCCRDAACHVSTATEYNRHYANLLLSELLYKNDYAQTNRTELQQAVSYFDSLVVNGADTRGVSLQTRPRRDARRASAQNIAFLDARAHYINGVGYYERDSLVPACAEYLKALEIMESHFEERELVGKKAKFVALTYTHLTLLLSDQYLHEQAIYFGHNALKYYDKFDAQPWHIAWILDEIGSQYDMMNQLDSADYYYSYSIGVLLDTNSLMYRDIASHSAYLKYEMGDKYNSILELRCLLSMSENEREFLARSLSIGELFYHEKQFDSARVYLDAVFHGSTLIDSKKQAAEWLVEICKERGVEDGIIDYAEFLVPYSNINENRGLQKSQIVTLCQDYQQNRLENLHRKETRRNQVTAKGTIGLLLCVVTIVCVFYFVSRKRQVRLRLQKETAERQLDSERHTHKMKQAALAGRLKRSNETLRQTEQQLEEVRFSINMATDGKNPNANMEAFKSSPICQYIIEVVENRNFKPKVNHYIYKDYALDRSQLKALVEAADQHLDNFTFRIRKKYPSLTDDDMKYCCLYLLGLNEADISALMQRAYSTVCDRNRKIKNIIGTKGELAVALMDWV